MSSLHESIIESTARSVRSAAATLPMHQEMSIELKDAAAANKRGYFLPDEDERLRTTFARYLSVRNVLLETIEPIQAVIKNSDPDNKQDALNEEQQWHLRLQSFIIGFTAATILVRTASFIIDLADKKPVVSKKLDEAESRYGIRPKSYTQIYKNLSSSRRMWRFHEALIFYENHLDDISQLRSDRIVGPLVTILDEEQPFLQYRKRDYIKRKWNYRLHSFKRRHVSGYRKAMFHLLKLSGSAIAEMKQPFIKPHGANKRVTDEAIRSIKPHLQAGDIFITRHDDAMSNLFLPGFWPHAALYIGEQEERDSLSVHLPKADGRDLSPFHFLESKKDGVLFRSIHETLAVDAFMVIRPNISKELIAKALLQAFSHEGKLYDFMFDFSQSQRLACTGLIYRAYHNIGPISLSLTQHAGRSCMSAEELIKQTTESGHFHKLIEFGVDSDNLKFFEK